MESEFTEIASKMEAVSRFERAGFRIYDGLLVQNPTLLLHCGVGKVNAALGVSMLAENFQPHAVFNIGVAGAMRNNELRPGDIIVSSEVLHHDVDLTAFGYELGQLPSLPKSFLADPKLLSLAQSIQVEGVRIRIGPIVSGDVFVQDRVLAKRIREQFPEALAVDMESAAIAQSCYRLGLPFIIIRSISDIIGEGTNSSDFNQFLALAKEQSSKFIVRMLQGMRRE